MNTGIQSNKASARLWRSAAIATMTIALSLGARAAIAGQGNTWTATGSPNTVAITNGPWTLEQSGAANGLKSAGYCDNAGNLIGNPGTERMAPYYFPFIVG